MSRIALLTAVAMMPLAALVAKPLNISLPIGETPKALGDSESQVVVNNCAACHSLDYIVSQPRHKGAQFWRDEVAKMVNVYKAPIAAEDAAAISEVLAGKFG